MFIKRQTWNLWRLDNRESVLKLAAEFGVTIIDWKKKRSEVKQLCASSSADCTEKHQTSKVSQFNKLNKALFYGFPWGEKKALH